MKLSSFEDYNTLVSLLKHILQKPSILRCFRVQRLLLIAIRPTQFPFKPDR